MGNPLRVTARVAVVAIVVAACGGGSDDSVDDINAVDGANTAETDPPDTAAESVPVTEAASEDDDDAIASPTVPEAEAPATPRCGDRNDAGTFDEVACDEPHGAEFVADIPTPADADAALEPGDDPAFHRACLDDFRTFFDGDVAGDFTDAAFVVVGETTQCWTYVPEPALVGSISEIGLAAAIAPWEFVDALSVGTCFRFPGDSVSFVEPVDCSESIEDVEVYQMLGSVPFEFDPTADDDANFDGGLDACNAMISTTRFDVPTAPSFFALIPTAVGAEVYDQRTATCIGDGLGEVLADDATASGARSIGDCTDSVETDYAPQPCDEPHDAQFAGVVDSPVEVLPLDADEASVLLTRVCAPLVGELVDRPIEAPAVSTGFLADAGLGEATQQIECFFEVGNDALRGSILEVGLEAALGDVAVLAELEPGTCFDFAASDNFSFGVVVDCTAPSALVFLGTFDAEGPAEWPGDDALREQRGIRCADILAASGIAADPATVSGTFPAQSSWEGSDRRLTTCDAAPA